MTCPPKPGTSTGTAGHGLTGCLKRCYCDQGYYEVTSSDSDSWAEMECIRCPVGSKCVDSETTFDTMLSQPGYWQIKKWFAKWNATSQGRGTPTTKFSSTGQRGFYYSRCSESIKCTAALKGKP